MRFKNVLHVVSVVFLILVAAAVTLPGEASSGASADTDTVRVIGRKALFMWTDKKPTVAKEDGGQLLDDNESGVRVVSFAVGDRLVVGPSPSPSQAKGFGMLVLPMTELYRGERTYFIMPDAGDLDYVGRGKYLAFGEARHYLQGFYTEVAAPRPGLAVLIYAGDVGAAPHGLYAEIVDVAGDTFTLVLLGDTELTTEDLGSPIMQDDHVVGVVYDVQPDRADRAGAVAAGAIYKEIK